MTATPSSGFPWKKGCFILLLLIGSLLAFDCRKNGSFEGKSFYLLSLFTFSIICLNITRNTISNVIEITFICLLTLILEIKFCNDIFTLKF